MVPDDERAARESQDALREALSRWASGVTIVAVRQEGQVHALTVSAFMPVSVDPPLVLVSLGPNASALPYLEPGTPFAISFLAADQRGLASRYADVMPVGPAPFADQGPPTIDAGVAALSCVVEDVRAAGDHHLVIGRVEAATTGKAGPALGYYRREYQQVG